jgi:hypothetical protein
VKEKGVWGCRSRIVSKVMESFIHHAMNFELMSVHLTVISVS